MSLAASRHCYWPAREDLAIKVAGLSAMAGGLLGLASAVTGLTGAQTLHWQAVGPFAFAHFIVRMDSLAAFMVLVISLLVTVCGLYSLSYVREYVGKGVGAMGFFMNLFIASMVGLVVMDNAFWFIVLFEMMSLASRFWSSPIRTTNPFTPVCSTSLSPTPGRY